MRRKQPQSNPTFEVRDDGDAAPGDMLRPLIELLRAIARRRRPAPPDIGPPAEAAATPGAAADGDRPVGPAPA
jgi:hypothetical protein